MNDIKVSLLVALLVSPALGSAWAGEGSQSPQANLGCETRSCDADVELERARTYLLLTARPGGTMARQGPEVAIERLHPEFAKRLAEAIQDARNAGLTEAGIFSAYRPPVFGVGGFADKYNSLHAYGLAVDMSGIGGPGSPEAQQWHEIAAQHGIVCPYGYRNRVEWNHCQPTRLESVKVQNPLRETITGAGPVDLKRMFETGNHFIADVASTLTSVIADRPARAFISAVTRPVRALVAAASTPARALTSRDARSSLARQRKTQRTGLASRISKVSRQARSSTKSSAPSRIRVAMVAKRPK